MIAPTPFFSDRGAHTQIYEEINALSQLGHEIVLCTYGLGRDVPGIDTRRCWVPKSYKKISAGPSYTKILLLPVLALLVLRTVRHEKPKIIHAHLHEGALIAKVVHLFFKRLPIVSDLQGSLVGECIQHNFIREGSMFARLLGFLEHRILSWFPVITQSDTMEKEFSQMVRHGHKIFNVLDGVDIDRFSPRSADLPLLDELKLPLNSTRILFMGLLEEYQGVDLMLEAFSIVAKSNPSVHFIIIGYPNLEKYQDLSKKMGFSDRCHFLGRIDYFDVPRYLSLATIAVAPKISTTEGDGKLYNYMSMAIPTVAFDRPVSREILGDCGLFAELKSSSDLATQIQIYLDDLNAAGVYGSNARKRVESSLTWKMVAVRIQSIYAEVI